MTIRAYQFDELLLILKDINLTFNRIARALEDRSCDVKTLIDFREEPDE
jgi:hypothetical protein